MLSNLADMGVLDQAVLHVQKPGLQKFQSFAKDSTLKQLPGFNWIETVDADPKAHGEEKADGNELAQTSEPEADPVSRKWIECYLYWIEEITFSPWADLICLSGILFTCLHTATSEAQGEQCLETGDIWHMLDLLFTIIRQGALIYIYIYIYIYITCIETDN